jgi:hypothetical protein
VQPIGVVFLSSLVSFAGVSFGSKTEMGLRCAPGRARRPSLRLGLEAIGGAKGDGKTAGPGVGNL